MYAAELLGMIDGQTRRNERTPIAALCGIAPVTKHIAHQLGKHRRDFRRTETLLVGLERQCVTGQRRRNYREGMGFSDALHLALCAPHEKFMTFDKAFATKAKKLGLRPAVALA